MTTSPAWSSPFRVSMVELVGSPAGTMTQTTRGDASSPVSCSSVSAVAAPLEATPARASADRSKATTSWPFWMRRSVMLAPIFPSPTMPIFMRHSRPRSRDLRQMVDGHPQDAPAVADETPVVAGGLRGDEGAEVVGLARDGQVRPRGARHDLHGHHRVRAP